MKITKSSSQMVVAPAVLVKSARWLSGIGVLALFFTKEISMGYFAFFASMLLIGFRVHTSPSILRWAGKIQPLLALATLALAVSDFLYGSRSFLLAVAHFLLCIQALRLLSLQTSRENLGSVLLSSLMMISASTLSVDWTFMLSLVLFVPCLIWTLMLYNLSIETESVIQKQPLWLNTIRALRSSALLAFWVTVLCCSLVFMVFPRFNFQGFRGQFLQPVAKTGMTNQVSLSPESSIFEDDTIVMRIQLDKSDLKKWPGYLRGPTVGGFDGINWKKSQASMTSTFYGIRGEFRFLEKKKSDNLLVQKIFLESMDSTALYYAGHVQSLVLDRPFVLLGKDGSVFRVNNDNWRIYYEVTSLLDSIPYPPWLSGLEREDYLSLNFLESDIPLSEYTQSIVKNETDPLRIAQRIERALQSDYSYSLDSRGVQPNNPIHSFLFETKKGHCEFFAASMAVMLRRAGIPSRLVTGFLSREWNRRGHYIVVRSKHAHAWVEAYIPEKGWVMFDPTPTSRDAVLGGTSEPSSWMQMLDSLNLTWNRTVMSYDMDRQVTMLMSFNKQSRSLSAKFNWNGAFWKEWKKSKGNQSNTQGLSFGSSSLVFAVIGLGLVLGGSLLWARRRRQTLSTRIHKKLSRFFQKRSLLSPTQTLAEAFTAAREKLSDQAESLSYLIGQYYQLRFDATYQPTPLALTEIKKHLKHLH